MSTLRWYLAFSAALFGLSVAVINYVELDDTKELLVLAISPLDYPPSLEAAVSTEKHGPMLVKSLRSLESLAKSQNQLAVGVIERQQQRNLLLAGLWLAVAAGCAVMAWRARAAL